MSNDPKISAQHLAQLARLELSPAEQSSLGAQLEAILEQFQALAQLDLEDVEPTLGATSLEDVKRADLPRPCSDREQLLRNAPDARDGFLSVPKTLGDGTA
jgi:aspartyl-tRNA(Asn)/glutamyl-tRNA(Gln) amidotransferase subunit C